MSKGFEPTQLFAIGALVLVLVGGFGIYTSKGITQGNEVTRSEISSLKQSHARDKRTLASLQQTLNGTDVDHPSDLTKSTPRTVQRIKSEVGRYGVQISELTLGGSKSQSLQSISQYIQTTPFPGLRGVPMSIHGTWTGINDFRRWIMQINDGAVAVTDLAVDGINFDMTVKIYGT